MAFADRLEAALKARGFEPLVDRAEIYAFEDWWKRIEALIDQAGTVVFVLLLRPPVLDKAEAWMAFRPSGALPPTAAELSVAILTKA
jgi:hypothetical protein